MTSQHSPSVESPRADGVAPSCPSIGLAVAHLFWSVGFGTDRGAVLTAVRSVPEGTQVVTVAMLGHKADLCTMILAPDQWILRAVQTDLARAGLELVDSYMSLTELSEYSAGLPEQMRRARLLPQLPPDGKPAFCFYPMSKRRGETDNWFRLPFDERKELMHEHGVSGRKFAGRVLQVVTGSTGLDDYEWGVTLFCEHPDDVKDVVYTMRFDSASARFGEFGTFYIGMVASPEDALASLPID